MYSRKPLVVGAILVSLVGMIIAFQLYQASTTITPSAGIEPAPQTVEGAREILKTVAPLTAIKADDGRVIGYHVGVKDGNARYTATLPQGMCVDYDGRTGSGTQFLSGHNTWTDSRYPERQRSLVETESLILSPEFTAYWSSCQEVPPAQ